MHIGVIADDFTGASDIANTLAKGVAPEGGLRTAQFSGISAEPVPSDIEAGVISLKSRSAPVAEAIRDSLAAMEWLRAQGCTQIIFKYCSTFDSTADGNIGPVAVALANALGVKNVICCPAFPTAGRTVYQGHLFVIDKLLSESGMQRHPLTPMTDPDIRRWLEGQSNGALVGHLPHSIVSQNSLAIQTQLSEMACDLVVADATTDQDLLVLGEALADVPLVTGGSGVALGLPRNFIRSGVAKGGLINAVTTNGPAAILAGSCSGATRGQVDHHANSHPTFPINVAAVMAGEVTADTLVSFIQDHQTDAPLVYSSGAPEDVKAMQARFGREAVSDTLDALFSETACTLIDAGYRRIVVAGGETSGAVAKAVADQLGSPTMQIGAEIDPGVPVLTLGDTDPVALALKSGNFGTVDFFEKALAKMTGAE